MTVKPPRFKVLFPALAISLLFLGASDAFAQRPALTRDVDNPALAPVRIVINVNMSAAEQQTTKDSYTVPAGRRLVIENASIWGFTNGTDRITGIWISPKDLLIFHMLDPTTTEVKLSAGGGTLIAYNRLIKGYFEAGETVQAFVFAEGTAGTKGVNINLQGYLVKP